MDIAGDRIPYIPSTGARRVHGAPLVVASSASLEGYGLLVDEPKTYPIEIVRWPAQGWRAIEVPLALPGDDVTPESFVAFWCDGGRALYLHPNVWHGAVVPHDDEAQFLDRQGRVHARVSVDFVREFSCYLSVSLRRPSS